MHSPHDAGQALRVTERDTEREAAGVRVVAVSGEADVESVAPLRAVLEAAGTTADVLVLDLSGVRFADSSMVNVLVRAHTDIEERLRIAAPSAFVRRLFDLTCLNDVLAVHDSVADAEAHARARALAPGE
ncbi:STAS domain-containing protein [Streptomyces sp. HMX112]|uniref:STAS domain-containing protein n=1 Tax=Streptomyces sp. HMX112 TaxID=3390850 RepID=UPI003A80B1DF